MERQSEGPKNNRFGAVKRAAVRLSPQELVKTSYFDPEEKFPLVMEPQVSKVNLATWAANNREMLASELDRHGAVLFRNFNVESMEQFQQFASAISSQLIEYGERSSPRHKVIEGVYTSTDHPAHQHIKLHNEQSYTLNWPMKIMFYCARPADEGGRTPIADSRKIYKRLRPETVEKFAQRGVMYVRNYGQGLALPWPEVFQTYDKAVVEEHCRAASIGFEWLEGNRLRTRQVRPAIRKHPRTGELTWFNHALFFHVSSLDADVRDSVLAVVREEDLPFNTMYGDGTPIEPDVLEELADAYQQETRSFAWMQGDVLVLDNMLTSHGREPFSGPRQVLASMTDPVETFVPGGAAVTEVS